MQILYGMIVLEREIAILPIHDDLGSDFFIVFISNV